MEGWVGLGGWLHTEINVRHRELNLDTVTHLSTKYDAFRSWGPNGICANLVHHPPATSSARSATGCFPHGLGSLPTTSHTRDDETRRIDGSVNESSGLFIVEILVIVGLPLETFEGLLVSRGEPALWLFQQLHVCCDVKGGLWCLYIGLPCQMLWHLSTTTSSRQITFQPAALPSRSTSPSVPTRKRFTSFYLFTGDLNHRVMIWLYPFWLWDIWQPCSASLGCVSFCTLTDNCNWIIDFFDKSVKRLIF